MHPPRHGFTLIELAIVLTIIGLLISGIIVGRSLIRGSQLKSIAGELAKYTQAISDFHDKYQALPGDMYNAESFWGSDTSCPGTPYTTVPHTATCNGDGNGHISDAYTGSAHDREMFRAWQQLADAGLIDGSFTGISGTNGSANAIIGQNVPASRLSGAGYTLLYVYTPFGNSTNWPAIYGNALAFGAPHANAITEGSALTPAEALAIDTKLDDGLPASGKILAPRINTLPNCLTTDIASTAQYNTSYTSNACGFFYITGF